MRRDQARAHRPHTAWSHAAVPAPATLTNIQSFFAHTTPIVPLHVSFDEGVDATVGGVRGMRSLLFGPLAHRLHHACGRR